MQKADKTFIYEYFKAQDEERALLRKNRELEEIKYELMNSNSFFAHVEENLNAAQTLAATFLCYSGSTDTETIDAEYSLLTGLILLMCRNEWPKDQKFQLIREYLEEPVSLLCGMLQKDVNRFKNFLDVIYVASHCFINSSREAQYEAVLHLKNRFSLFEY